jgi:urease accessory protein
MLVTAVLGTAGEMDLAGRRIERIYLDAESMAKAHQRARTDLGTEVGISLPRGIVLNPGDVLALNEERAIVVEGVEEDVFVIRPRTPLQWALAGFHLGNRHCQPFFQADEVLVAYDHTLDGLLREIGLDYERSRRRLVGLRPVVHAH